MANKPVVVEAVGTAVGKGGFSGNDIERVMAEAGLKAMQEGITDPDEIRARKLAARQALKDAARDEAASKNDADAV